MSTHVKLSNSWPGSWYQDHPIKKNYEVQLTTNSMFKDEIDFFLKKRHNKKLQLKEWWPNLIQK